MDAGASSISPELEAFAREAIDKGVALVKKGEKVAPFTMIAIGDEIVSKEHPADDPDKTMSSVKKEILAHDPTSSCYALVYDGYIKANKSEIDAVVVEFASRSDILAHAIAVPYCGEGESFEVEDEPTYLGEVPSLYILARAKDPL